MKKMITIALALVMLVSAVALFAGCAKDENTLVMATNAAFPPYEYREGDEIKGIDAEIAAAIAEKLGMTLKIEDVEFGSVLTGVAEGKYDMGMAGITVTEDRQKTMDFSNTYAIGIQVMIVREDSEITGLDSVFNFDEEGNPVSLKNTDLKIGVQENTTGDIYSSDAVTNWGFNDLKEDGSIDIDRVNRYRTGAEAVAALKSGKVDMVIIDNEPAKSYVAANEGIHIIEGENYAEEQYAICVKKGNTELLNKINQALAELEADGTLAAIIDKYIPANGDAETGDETGAESGAESDADTGAESGAESDAATGAESGAESDAATGAESGAESDASTGAESGAESDAATGAESSTESAQ